MIDKNIIAFSKYLKYAVGGAEKSMFHVLENEFKKGKNVTIISFSGLNNLGAKSKISSNPKGWKELYIKPRIELSRFSHIEYFINKPDKFNSLFFF